MLEISNIEANLNFDLGEIKDLKVAFVGDVHLWHSVPSSRKDNYPETMLSKLEFIFKKNYDIIFFLGDIFHTPIVSQFYLNRVIELFETYPDVMKFEIVGNHDLMYNNPKHLRKCSLFNLHVSGVCSLFEIVKVKSGDDNLYFHATLLDAFKNPHPVEGGKNFLLGHYFYEFDHEDYVLKATDVPKDFNYVILGHDHCIYPPLEQENFIVLRPGGLSRNTSLKYNVVREVGYYEYINNKFEWVSVPVEKDVFVYERVNKLKTQDKNEAKGINELAKYVEQFQKDGSKTKVEIREVLKSLEDRTEIVAYLFKVFELVGL